MKLGLFCLIVLYCLSSCKQQPEYVNGGVFVTADKSVLFTTQSILTVTSKRQRGGSTTRSGYTNFYLCATDINSGKELQKIKLGDYKNRITYLGTLAGKPWFFSLNPSIGLHNRNVETLQVENSVTEIIAKNPGIASGFTEAEYQHNIDSSGKYLFATGKDGYHYLIDPTTLIATKTNERSNRRFYVSDIKKSGFSIKITDSLEIGFKGNSGRKSLTVEKKQLDNKLLAFYSSGNRKPNKNFYYKTLAEEVYDEISFIDPICLVNTTMPADEDDRDPVLKKGNQLIVLHKSLLGNEFHWIVTALEITYQNKPRQLWHYPITHTSKLDWSKKEVLYSAITGDKLLLVFKNITVAVDLQTGQLLWDKKFN